MTRIGKLIRDGRQAQDMTQRELAEAMGYLNAGSIRNFESGARDIPITQLIKLSEALGLAPGQIIGALTDDYKKQLIALWDS